MHTPAAPQFLDVEIRILAPCEAGFPVEVTLGGEQQFPRGVLPHTLAPWISSGDALADGRRLFTALLGDGSPHEAWVEARGRSARRRVRLRIDGDASALHAVPWELLHDGETWLAADADTPFSRYLPVAKPWGRAERDVPLRILALLSNPADLEALYGLSPVAVDAERALLETAFFTLEGEGAHLDFLEPPITPARVETQLQVGYQVVHYVGHGAFNARRQQAALYLQDAAGDTQIVREDVLVGMLARQEAPPPLVFLAACQSASRSTADAFRGLGPRLVVTGVPAVIAMRDFVTVKTTRALTLAFYRHLARHGVVDRAMNAARSLLLTAERPDAAIPVLFMRLVSGRLWGAEVSPESVGVQVNITGEVSGQVAVGGAGPTTQIGAIHGQTVTIGGTAIMQPAPLEAFEQQELRRLVADLRSRVPLDAPEMVRAEALVQLAALEVAVTVAQPDVATLRAVERWFAVHVPRLAGAITHSVMGHPALRPWVEAAG